MNVNINASISEDSVKIVVLPQVIQVNVTRTPYVAWGGITGTLSAQTDLQSALDAKVPTARTLTINGTTQDLSANRTFTIPTDLTIGSTAIASGTIGRVLFQGTGNVVQQSSSLFWDSTNNRLGIGTSSPTAPIHVETSGLTTGVFITTGNDGGFTSQNNGTLANNRTSQIRVANGTTLFGANDRTYQLVNIGRSSTTADFYFQYWDGSTYNDRFRIFANGNVGIGTGGTDAGFKLDVNGTARVQGQLSLGLTGTAGRVNFARSSNGTMIGAIYTSGNDLIIENGSQGTIFSNIGAERMRIAPTTGNILINTTTDAGFKFDVNGTARVQGKATFGLSSLIGTETAIFTTDSATNSFIRVYNSNTTVGSTSGIVLTNNTSGNSSAAIWGDSIDTSGNTRLRFQTSAAFTSIDRMVITESGNVGIGTSNIFNYLGYIRQLEIAGDSASLNLFSVASNKKWVMGVGAGGNLGLYENNLLSPSIFFNSNGNVQIGTSINAGFKFDVNGTMRVQNVLTLANLSSDRTGANGMIYYNTTLGMYRVYQSGAWKTITAI